MKRYTLLIILFLGIFTFSCGNNNSSTENSESITLSTDDRISKPGEYEGYSDVIYSDEYEITSQYVPANDGYYEVEWEEVSSRSHTKPSHVHVFKIEISADIDIVFREGPDIIVIDR